MKDSISSRCHLEFLKERCSFGVALLPQSDFPQGVFVALLPKQHANIRIPGTFDSGQEWEVAIARVRQTKDRAQACAGLISETKILRTGPVFRDRELNSIESQVSEFL